MGNAPTGQREAPPDDKLRAAPTSSASRWSAWASLRSAQPTSAAPSDLAFAHTLSISFCPQCVEEILIAHAALNRELSKSRVDCVDNLLFEIVVLDQEQFAVALHSYTVASNLHREKRNRDSGDAESSFRITLARASWLQ